MARRDRVSKADQDGAYKLVFEDPRVVRGLLVSQFKEQEWLKRIDWNTLEPFPGERISERTLPEIAACDEQHQITEAVKADCESSAREWTIGRQERRYNDAVWRLKYKDSDQWLYFYLAFEFQSTVDRRMPIRTLVYRALLLQRIADLHPKAKRLPQTFVIVIYNGEEPWTAPESLGVMSEPMPQDLQ